MKFLFFVVLSVVSAEDVGNNWETFKVWTTDSKLLAIIFFLLFLYFQATHGKEYTASTEVFRAKIFALEDKKIQEHNLANSDYKRAHNMFSDLVMSEFLYFFVQLISVLSLLTRTLEISCIFFI